MCENDESMIDEAERKGETQEEEEGERGGNYLHWEGQEEEGAVCREVAAAHVHIGEQREER